jgi:hypothetical protein
MDTNQTSNLESNSFLIKKIDPSLKKEFKNLGNTILCNWLINPETWEKERFAAEIIEFIECSQGINAYPNMVLIGMLTHQIDIYVECSKQIAQKGLIEGYNKGATTGPSIYFSMADKALN